MPTIFELGQYRPYADAQSATDERHDIEAKNFKSIVKR
jgi:hypothetical protein